MAFTQGLESSGLGPQKETAPVVAGQILSFLVEGKAGPGRRHGIREHGKERSFRALTHKDDDDHKRRLGPRCDRCHNVRGWKYWVFNHTKQTNFRLIGKHKGLKCEACHLQPMRKKISLPGDCNSCHGDDDIHNGDFGDACERCHYSSTWKKVKTGTGLVESIR